MGTTNLRKCKNCGIKFMPKYSTLQATCSFECAKVYGKKLLEKSQKEERKQIKESLLTHKDYLKILQKVFNSYIRLRDRDKPCISCGKIINGKGHASHFFSVGHYPNLRFNEFNVNLSCVECNVHLHGNTAEYAIRLPERIGNKNYEYLLSIREIPLKLTIEEIKEKIIYYKQQMKL
jgi:predicted RNA-binding Zn-ribbon protein involved in translation (DUF1610 family)